MILVEPSLDNHDNMDKNRPIGFGEKDTVAYYNYSLFLCVQGRISTLLYSPFSKHFDF